MNKGIGLALLAVGIALIVYGAHSSDSAASPISALYAALCVDLIDMILRVLLAPAVSHVRLVPGSRAPRGKIVSMIMTADLFRRGKNMAIMALATQRHGKDSVP